MKLLDGIILVITALGGSKLLDFLFNLITKGRSQSWTQRKETFDSVNAILKEELDIARTNNKTLQTKLDESEKNYFDKMLIKHNIIADQRSRISLLESSGIEGPIPKCNKDINLRIVEINNSFADAFLLPTNKNKLDCVGRNMEEIWPNIELDGNILSSDRQCIRTKNRVISVEKMPVNGHQEPFVVIKQPNIHINKVIGISCTYLELAEVVIELKSKGVKLE